MRRTECQDVYCASYLPDVVWTGSHFLVGWYADGVPANRPSWPLMLSVYDEDGTLVRHTTLVDDGTETTLQRLSVSGERVLVLTRRGYPGSAAAYVVDLEGNLLTEAPLDGEGRPWQEAQASPTPDGWLVFGFGTDMAVRSYLLGRMSRDGALLDEPRFVTPNGIIDYIQLAPVPGGGHLLVGSERTDEGLDERFVQRLDDSGNVLDEWTSIPGEQQYLSVPFVVYVRGEPYVMYGESCVDYEPNAVRLMYIACGT